MLDVHRTPRPIWLWIDPSRSCNLACRFCYSKRAHAEETLNRATLAKMLDVLLGDSSIRIQKLNFNWRGDPTMNAELPALLREIDGRAPNFPVEFHTNGTLIDEALADELIGAAGRIQIFVSIDGGNARAHDFNRGAGSFAKALAGLGYLVAARGERPRPPLGVFQLDLGEDESQYDPCLVQLATAVDEWVRIDPVHPVTGLRLRLRRRTPTADTDRTRLLPVSDRWWAREIPTVSEAPEQPCFWVGNSLFIAPDGRASVCLLSATDLGVLGNVLTDPLELIIDRAAQFRAQIVAAGRSDVPHCSGCRMAPGSPVPVLGAAE